MRNEFLNTTIADTDPEVSEAINKEDDEKMRNDFFNASIAEVDPEVSELSLIHISEPTRPY